MDISGQTQLIIVDICILIFCVAILLWFDYRIGKIREKLNAVITACKYLNNTCDRGSTKHKPDNSKP